MLKERVFIYFFMYCKLTIHIIRVGGGGIYYRHHTHQLNNKRLQKLILKNVLSFKSKIVKIFSYKHINKKKWQVHHQILH